MTTVKNPNNLPPEIASEVTLDLSGHEGQFVEFKQAVTDLSREMVGFANAEGGRIYVGVADNQEIKGIAINNRILSQIQDMARKCDPPIAIRLYPIKRVDKDLLLIQVPEGESKPYGCSDGYFLRTGPSSQKMNRNELLAFVRAVHVIPWERQDCKKFAYPKDFNNAAFKEFVKAAGISANVSPKNLLVNLELARLEDDRLVVNNACVLFFAKRPVRFFPQARISCILFQSPKRIDILDRKDLEGGLFEIANEAEVFLLKHLRLRYAIKEFKREDHHEIPVPALREGILNALIHRDYSIYGGNISMEINPSQFLISSPGGLPPGLPPSRFGDTSIRRNALIADLFNRVGKVERAGSGIRRIREAVANERALEPEFKFDTFFDLIFPRYTDEQWSALAKEDAIDRTSTVQAPIKYRISSEQAVERVKLLEFCRTPKIMKDIMVHMNLSHRPTFMKNYLRPLLREEFLAMTNPESPNSPKQKYMVTPAGENYLKTAHKLSGALP